MPAAGPPTSLPERSSIAPGALELAAAKASLAGDAGSDPVSAAVAPSTGSAVWNNLTGSQSVSPPPTALASMVWDAKDGYVLLFGGCSTADCFGPPRNQTWIFRGGAWSELNLSVEPPARSIAQMAYDPVDQEVVLFGGLAGSGSHLRVLNDTWTFSGGVWTNLTPSLSVAPNPRYRGMMTYDATDGYVLLFGGTASDSTTVQPFSDTWSFVHQKWTNLTASVSGNPPPRFRATMVDDVGDGYVLLFGGCTSVTTCPTQDTWTYEHLRWKVLASNASTAPAPQVYPVMAYDALDGYVVLFGGNHTTDPGSLLYDATWAFSGGKWRNLSAGLRGTPPAEGEGSMVYDPADNLTLLFGGFAGAGLEARSYAYGPAIVVTASADPPTLDLGENTTLTVRASTAGGGTLSYAYSGLPGGCASANLSALLCLPNETGTFPVSINVTDELGDSAEASLTLSVGSDPQIEGFNATPENFTLGNSTNLSATVDGGSPPYTEAFEGLPSGCASEDALSLLCLPNASGSFPVELLVRDTTGFTRSANLTLTVHPRPGIGEFTASPSVLDVGQTLVLSVNSSGGTAPLSVEYSNLPPGCASADLMAFSCRPNASGTWRVEASVVDADGWNASANVSVRVNEPLSIPSAGLSAPQVDRGLPVTLWLNASGGTGPFSFNYSLPSGCASENLTPVRCVVEEVGNFTLFAEVRDAAGEVATRSFLLAVVPAPTLRSFLVSPEVIDLGGAVNLSGLVLGGTGPFAYEYLGLPPGCPAADVATLYCAPSAPGPESVRFVATDAFGLNVSENATFLVNPDPAISSFTIDPANVTEGSRVTLTAVASGGTGPLTYSYGDLPAGCVSANFSRFPCDPEALGEFAIVLTVRDALNRSASQVATLDVLAPAPSPGPTGRAGFPVDAAVIVLGVVVLLAAIGVLVLFRRRRPPPQATDSATPEAPSGAPPEELYLPGPSNPTPPEGAGADLGRGEP